MAAGVAGQRVVSSRSLSHIDGPTDLERACRTVPTSLAKSANTGRTRDHKEAARAFVEKRAPVFAGR